MQVEALLDLVGLNVNEPDEEGELPLCAAATNGHGTIILKVRTTRTASLAGGPFRCLGNT